MTKDLTITSKVPMGTRRTPNGSDINVFHAEYLFMPLPGKLQGVLWHIPSGKNTADWRQTALNDGCKMNPNGTVSVPLGMLPDGASKYDTDNDGRCDCVIFDDGADAANEIHLIAGPPDDVAKAAGITTDLGIAGTLLA